MKVNIGTATATINLTLERLSMMSKYDKVLLKDVLSYFDLKNINDNFAINEEVVRKSQKVMEQGLITKSIEQIFKNIPTNTLSELYIKKAKDSISFEEEYQVYLEYKRKYNDLVINTVTNLKLAAQQLSNIINMFSMKNQDVFQFTEYLLLQIVDLTKDQYELMPSLISEIDAELERIKEDIDKKRKKYATEATQSKSFDYMLTTKSPTKTTRIIYALIAAGIILDNEGNRIPIENASKVAKDFIIAFNGNDHPYTNTFIHKIQELKKEYIFEWQPEQESAFLKKSNKEYTTKILDFIELNQKLDEAIKSISSKNE